MISSLLARICLSRSSLSVTTNRCRKALESRKKTYSNGQSCCWPSYYRKLARIISWASTPPLDTFGLALMMMTLLSRSPWRPSKGAGLEPITFGLQLHQLLVDQMVLVLMEKIQDIGKKEKLEDPCGNNLQGVIGRSNIPPARYTYKNPNLYPLSAVCSAPLFFCPSISNHVPFSPVKSVIVKRWLNSATYRNNSDIIELIFNEICACCWARKSRKSKRRARGGFSFCLVSLQLVGGVRLLFLLRRSSRTSRSKTALG